MPNGHNQREEDERKLIKAIEQEGWDHYQDPDDWIIEAARSDELHRGGGFTPSRDTYHGDNYIYLAVSSVHGLHVHVFSRKKSEHFETTPEEGTCPHCQEYVRRREDDDYLTCHRCGWQHKPFSEWVSNLFD